jgi:6-pyruvoyltetrahydropterin/6-carboxytetrahydropterin synthase
MPVCAATRRSHFNAAHRLHNPARSDDWNAATFGLCNNPNFHGHNYELDVTVEGSIDRETGYVFDLGRLADVVDERIIRRLDHRNLNVEVEWFADLNPTVENIAVVIWRELRAALPESLTLRVRLWETPRNYVEYQGG